MVDAFAGALEAVPQTLELFPEVPSLPPCSVCGAHGFTPDCFRCDMRKRLFRPLSPEEKAANVAASREREARREAEHRAREERLSRLAGLGRPVRLALLGCGAKKLQHPAPARSLYVGPLFRASLRYAEEVLKPDEVLILSARHHVVGLDDVLEPYEHTLAGVRKVERLAWARMCGSRLASRFPGLRVEAHFLAGEAYAPWWGLLTDWTVEEPLEGLSQGRRLAFYARAFQAAQEVRP